MNLSARTFALGLVVASFGSYGLTGCSTYQDELQRGQRAYEQNAHERALAIFRAGENDIGRLSPEDRARYAYLRGMTDFRVGYRGDARHWLSLALSWENATPSALPKSWKTRLGQTLTELNDVVWKDGTAALEAEKGPPSKSAAKEEEPEAAAPSPPEAKEPSKPVRKPRRKSAEPVEKPVAKPASDDDE